MKIERLAYSPDEAAAALGITRQTVYELIKRGELRRFKVGRCTRIPVVDVLALIGGGEPLMVDVVTQKVLGDRQLDP